MEATLKNWIYSLMGFAFNFNTGEFMWATAATSDISGGLDNLLLANGTDNLTLASDTINDVLLLN